MSYLIYNGKRVISSNKYVTKASISPGPAAANFTVSNARMYVHQGDGNSF